MTYRLALHLTHKEYPLREGSFASEEAAQEAVDTLVMHIENRVQEMSKRGWEPADVLIRIDPLTVIAFGSLQAIHIEAILPIQVPSA